MTLSKNYKTIFSTLLICFLFAPTVQAGTFFEDVLNLTTLGQYDRQKKENEARKRREAEERARLAKIQSYKDQIAAKKQSQTILQNEIDFINSQLGSKEKMITKVQELLVLMDDIYQQSLGAKSHEEQALLNQQAQDEVSQSMIEIIKTLSQSDQSTIEVEFLENSIQALSKNMEEDIYLVMEYLSQLTEKTLVMMMGNLKFIEAVSMHESKELKERSSLKTAEMSTLKKNVNSLEKTLDDIVNPKPAKVTNPAVLNHLNGTCRGSRCTLRP